MLLFTSECLHNGRLSGYRSECDVGENPLYYTGISYVKRSVSTLCTSCVSIYLLHMKHT